jgi:uncharacterized protein DUF2612
MALTVDYISDWQSRLRGRIYQQFKGKPKILAWVDMIARQAQDLEDAFQALFTLVNIDDSFGAQLDNLGRVLGQPRNGVADSVYRLYLRARIVAEKSGGRSEDIYRVFAALFPGAPLYLRSGGIKSFFLRIGAQLTRAQALVAAQFLTEAKEAGARADLIWQESPTNALFTLDAGPGFGVGVFTGAIGV